ncbi:MAG: Protein kinase [Myxococcales bacterium]|nr:Protein kinase [Myxococcales bacterium]
MACPDDVMLTNLVGNGLPAERHSEIVAHMDQCPSCLALVAELMRAHPQRLAAHTRVDRYVIERCLGAGAMGVVYAAHDPQLERRVALKLLQPSQHRDELVPRLLREARMMAQLSHPNVVAVHEAGSIDGTPFVVMEQIEGQDLGAWCAAAPRGVDELVRIVADVARGLAAVHGVGLVHRDVKPGNILVGKDGRARLGDFGLAGFHEPGEHADSDLDSDLRLTQTGQVVGTPAYMAPERFRGEDAVPASDQFSLCVVLYEALYGQRPFAGATFGELTRAVLAGEIREPRSDRRVPASIKRAIDRGLAIDPSARFPSVSALAVALEQRPRSRTRWAAVAGVALLAIAGVALFVQPAATDPCAGGAGELAEIWNPERHATLQRVFAASDRPFAVATATHVAEGLDRYAAGWIDAHHASCVANRVRHVESDALFDRRLECLEQRKRGLVALTAVLTATPTAGEIERSSAAVVAMSPVSDCTDVQMRAETMARPSDPAARTALAALEQRAARLKAQHDLGNYKAALADAKSLVADQAKLDYPPLAMSTLGLQAMLQLRTGDDKGSEASFRAALAAAARAHDDAEIVRLWGALLNVIGVIEGRPDAALALVDTAKLALVRAGSPPALEAKLDTNIGAVMRAKGDLAGAHGTLARALATSERVYGTDAPESMTTMTNYANVLWTQGAHAEALAIDERILAIQTRVHGAEHPFAAQARVNIAAVLDTMGDHARAITETKAALAILEPAWGKAHKSVLVLWNNLGVALGNQGNVAEATAAFEHVLAAEQQAPVAAADAMNGLAKLALGAGDPARAAAMLERSLGLREKHQGPTHPDVGIALVNLGDALRAQSKCADALPRYERALPLLEASLGKEHGFVAQGLAGEGRCLLDLGRRAAAVPVLERARAIATSTANTELAKQIAAWLR